MYPQDYHYTREHEWIRIQGDIGTVGITDYAQHELGDVVFVELPAVGRVLDTNEEFGTIESVKAVSELFNPVAGEIVEVNELLVSEPETINEDPHGEGWLIRLRVSGGDLSDLMNAEQYQEFIHSAKTE